MPIKKPKAPKSPTTKEEKMIARTIAMISDPSVPFEHRKHSLMQLCMADGDNIDQAVAGVLDSVGKAHPETLYQKKIQELNETLAQLQQGPLRAATFLRLLEGVGETRRAAVTFEDGSSALVPVPDEQLAASLARGDTVLLEAQAKALLYRDPGLPVVGDQARLQRLLPDSRVEVLVRDHERYVYQTCEALERQLVAGEVEPGATLLVCQRRMMAFEALPPEDGLAHYRFLARDQVPDVRIERDLGAPPAYMREILDLVRLEMERPEIRRRWKLRRSATRLLEGVSGSGKTFSIMALWRALYDLMSGLTGVAVDELPPRVMRLRPSEILSKWVGDSDKNLDRFFDEAEQLAAEVYHSPDGSTWELPVLIIIEELDGMGRARGEEPIYDRILSTILQRLDMSRSSLAEKLILFVATTNVAHHIDPALLRRIGGVVEHFGRLDRRGLTAVLDKTLTGLPLCDGQASTDAGELEARGQLIGEISSWLFPPDHADEGLVELVYAGSSQPVTKYRRDFLTAALLDQAVQQAAITCSRRQAGGDDDAVLDRETLMTAIDDQVRGVVDRLHESNTHHYVDLPDSVRVASVRRLPRPTMQPFTIERVA